jgi:hypothetical protein
MNEHFSSYLDLLLFQPAVMFTVNQYTRILTTAHSPASDRVAGGAPRCQPPVGLDRGRGRAAASSRAWLRPASPSRQWNSDSAVLR